MIHSKVILLNVIEKQQYINSKDYFINCQTNYFKFYEVILKKKTQILTIITSFQHFKLVKCT